MTDKASWGQGLLVTHIDYKEMEVLTCWNILLALSFSVNCDFILRHSCSGVVEMEKHSCSGAVEMEKIIKLSNVKIVVNHWLLKTELSIVNKYSLSLSHPFAPQTLPTNAGVSLYSGGQELSEKIKKHQM